MQPAYQRRQGELLPCPEFCVAGDAVGVSNAVPQALVAVARQRNALQGVACLDGVAAAPGCVVVVDGLVGGTKLALGDVVGLAFVGVSSFSVQ